MPNRIPPPRITIWQRVKNTPKPVGGFIDRRPLLSFIIALAILVGLIALSNFLPKPPTEQPSQPSTKQVEVYRIGGLPKVTVQAQVKKSGVIRINALTGGVVNQLPVTEGTRVKKGQLLIGMSANYAGGNPIAVQRQIAQKQYQTAKDTLDAQKEIIQKQKDIATKSDENNDQLRDITAKSIAETQDVIAANEAVLDDVQAQIDELTQNPDTPQEALYPLRQLRAQLLAATNQARQGLRTAEYQAAGDKPPAQLSDITREMTIKQLEVQEKQLVLSVEVSRLQVVAAQINESLYFPTAPFSGIIERVLVKQFETVSPGQPLLVLSQTKEEDPITAVAYVSRDIAQRVSMMEPTTLYFGSQSQQSTPTFVSTEAVEGTLYAVYYPLPDNLTGELVNDGFIVADIPLGYPQTSAAAPFIPIDSVFQTREKSYVYVIGDDGKAQSREVTLGAVYGSSVEITSGLSGNEAVILNRNVIEGDQVQATAP